MHAHCSVHCPRVLGTLRHLNAAGQRRTNAYRSFSCASLPSSQGVCWSGCCVCPLTQPPNGPHPLPSCIKHGFSKRPTVLLLSNPRKIRHNFKNHSRLMHTDECSAAENFIKSKEKQPFVIRTLFDFYGECGRSEPTWFSKAKDIQRTASAERRNSPSCRKENKSTRQQCILLIQTPTSNKTRSAIVFHSPPLLSVDRHSHMIKDCPIPAWRRWLKWSRSNYCNRGENGWGAY